MENQLESTKRKTKTNESIGFGYYWNQRWNFIQSIYMIFTWIVLGCHLEIVGPTMGILANNIHVTYSGMGSALAMRSFGYFLANIFGALLSSIVENHSELLLFIAFFAPFLVVLITPFIHSIVLMCILFLIQGSSQGLTDLAGTNVLLTMWKDFASAPLSCAHLGYGIGAFLLNIFIRPFILQETKENSDQMKINSTDEMIKSSTIVYPYSFVSILCLIISFGHLFFYFRKRKTNRKKLNVQQINYSIVQTNENHLEENLSIENQNENEEKIVEETKTKKKKKMKKGDVSSYSPQICGRGSFQYGLISSLIYIFYTFFIGGNDQTFSKFYFTYLKFEKFQISTGAASWAISLYWLSYSIGRLIFAVVSVYLRVDYCLNIVWSGGILLALLWFIFVWFIGLTSTTLFILGAFTGLIFSPIFPLSFGLINQRLNVIPLLISLLLSGSALGSIVFQKLAGFVMDVNPNHFPTILILCLILSISLYVLSTIIYLIHEKKQKKRENPSSSKSNEINLQEKPLANEEEEIINYLSRQEREDDLSHRQS